MKAISKILLIAMTLFIVNFSPVFAQGKGSTLFGVTAGVNFADVGDLPVTTPPTTTKMLIGFHVGAFVDIGLSDNFYFQPGVIYTAIGANDNSSGTILYNGVQIAYKSDLDNKLGYIQIPLNFSYRLESGLNFNIDPYIGINLSAKEKGTITASAGGFSQSESIDVDLKNPPGGGTSLINSIDFGFGFGIGYLMQSGLGFKAAYSLGLTKVQKEDTSTIPSTPASITNNVITVSVLYEFGKK